LHFGLEEIVADDVAKASHNSGAVIAVNSRFIVVALASQKVKKISAKESGWFL